MCVCVCVWCGVCGVCGVVYVCMCVWCMCECVQGESVKVSLLPHPPQAHLLQGVKQLHEVFRILPKQERDSPANTNHHGNKYIAVRDTTITVALAGHRVHSLCKAANCRVRHHLELGILWGKVEVGLQCGLCITCTHTPHTIHSSHPPHPHTSRASHNTLLTSTTHILHLVGRLSCSIPSATLET